ncbi:MAG: LysM peptidoglycan-binding domain-containing protein [Syntrophaceae bacterium]|nr:LysM peptidoglycan-binding domain-containing protein [Syntrophaceae bacterium]
MKRRRACLWAFLIGFVLFLLVPSSADAERYRVRPGDSLYRIAKKFRVSMDSIRSANGLEGDALKVGQVLVIPDGRSAKRAAEKPSKDRSSPLDPEVYVVQRGDTLAGVAAKTGVPASEIRKMNGLRSSKLKTGQRLVLKESVIDPAEVDDLEEAGSIEADELAARDEAVEPGEGFPLPAPNRWRGLAEPDLFVRMVKSFEGVPYKLGGNSMRGIDCSAFTRKIYGVFGIDLPRTAREQLRCGKRIERGDLDTGDLVFFRTRKNRIHVGIFLGGGEFFHLSSRNRGGKVDDIDSAYFSSRFIGGVRLIEADASAKAKTPKAPGMPAAVPGPAMTPSAEAAHPPGG